MHCVAIIKMRQIELKAILQRLLLAAAINCSAALAAEQATDTYHDSSDNTALDERSMRNAIRDIESRHGAYAADLPEQILSLGLALQAQDRHGEAMSTFKRGVHLARINNGLYSVEQIPLLHGEIESAIALGEYGKVDQLQEYLYRVQQRSLPAGETRADALLQQAAWQFKAYQLELGTAGPERLLTMQDLYYRAWNDLRSIEEENSPKLLPPLYGLQRTQYLISEHQAANDATVNNFNSNFNSANANRFYAYRARNYDTGRNVIVAIYKIHRDNSGASSDEAVQAAVSLGDWAMWYDKRDEATQIYQYALAELALRDDAQEEGPALLSEPVPLPDVKGLRKLPPPVSPEEGNILVEFGVDRRGKVLDLTRLDTNEDMDPTATRLMRVLRGTKFRPRFESGEPVETDKLVRAYDIKSSE